MRPIRRIVVGAVVAVVTATTALTSCSLNGSTTGPSESASSPVSNRPTESANPAAPQNPLIGARLWINPQAKAQLQADAWQRDGEPAKAAALKPITSQPVATWLSSPHDPYAEVEQVTTAAAAAGELPVLVLYHRPYRDCGSFSAGGSAGVSDYLSWVNRVAAGLGERRALLVLEPDAIPQTINGACGDSERATRTYEMLAQAVDILKRQPHALVYLDAGHSTWISNQRTLAAALKTSGIGHADGFSLNVSNFQTTNSSVKYGDDLSGLLGKAQYVVDVSRNGRGAPDAPRGSIDAWCNPASAGLGENPRIGPDRALAVAFLWIKEPGNSDGDCRPGEPKAGDFWPAYALQLIRQRPPAR